MLFVYLTLCCWIVMILYWVITAKIDSQTSVKSELIPLLKLIGSALLMYLPLITGGWLSARFYTSNPWTNIPGVLLCASGAGLAIWARKTLGKNWSGRVMIQQEHHLAVEGPYRVIRHPIYAGALFAMTGVFLVLGYIFSFVYLAFSVFGLIRKSRQEETLLSDQFPAQYDQYRQRTKMLIPYVL